MCAVGVQLVYPNRRCTDMKAMNYAMSNQSGCCMYSAVAGTSMGEIMILDTAVVAVSVFVIQLIGLLVLKG